MRLAGKFQQRDSGPGPVNPALALALALAGAHAALTRSRARRSVSLEWLERASRSLDGWKRSQWCAEVGGLAVLQSAWVARLLLPDSVEAYLRRVPQEVVHSTPSPLEAAVDTLLVAAAKVRKELPKEARGQARSHQLSQTAVERNEVYSLAVAVVWMQVCWYPEKI